MFKFITLAMGAVLIAASGAAAQMRDATPWSEAPGRERIAQAHPLLAAELRISGEAVLSCTVEAHGRPADCEVLRESPAGWGFGFAALSLAPYFKFQRYGADTGSSGPRRVDLPVPFPAPPIGDGPPVNTQAVETSSAGERAQRLYRAARPDFQHYDSMLARLGRLTDLPMPGVDPILKARVLAALREATDTSHETFLAHAAVPFAEGMTSAQLDASIAFYESSAGRKLARVHPLSSSTMRSVRTSFLLAWRYAIAEELCRRIACADDVSNDPAEPAWSRSPTIDQIARSGPTLGQRTGIQGVVRLACKPAPDGAIMGCRVVSERPSGLGYADAALSLTPYYQLASDSLPPGEIYPVVRFAARRPEPPAVALGAPDGRAMQISQSLFAERMAQSIRDFSEAHYRSINDPGAKSPEEGRRLVEEIARAEFERLLPVVLRRGVEAVAREFTLDELEAAQQFQRSDAGMRFNAIQIAGAEAAVANVEAAASYLLGLRAARAEVCRIYACNVTPAAGSPGAEPSAVLRP
ncbi:hypothetical protein [Phenylobacterium sp.]|uniref:hypothetical protein n=1 Tax=Phenylobacterium sp. TaxID=1871053 RepID=UPI00301C0625